MKINFDIENCYGIGKLFKEFDFKDDKPIVIHSSNGTMKTSLCKTLIDIQQGRASKDQIYPAKVVKRNIKIDGIDAKSEDFLVFNSYEESYVSQSISKIILDNTLKKTYDNVIQDQLAIENEILAKVSKVIGQKADNTKQIFMTAFNCSSFLEAASKADKIKKSSLKIHSLKKFKYKELFDKPIQTLVSKDEIRNSLRKYNNQYKKMLKKSPVFTSGVFEISNLNNISVVLKTENYFKGNNKLIINNYPIPIETDDQLNQLIKDELSRIDEDPKIQNSFKAVVDACGTQKNLSGFFEILKEEKTLSKLFTNIVQLEKNYLSFHVSQFPDDLSSLLTKSKANKAILKSLITKANKTVSDWENIIKIFKDRFSVPYNVSIENQANAILGIDEPIFKFTYGTNPIDEKNLVDNVLSSSEKRAYYLLQVLFDVNRYMNSLKSKILVFDDIADSFDYTNKYAIIEYLSEISNHSKFRLIVLTHNFDFYRSFGLKVASRKNSYFALKDGSSIIISEGEYLENLFQFYKSQIGRKLSIDLTVIGFARNLIEYYVDDYINDADYSFYTSLLHYRPHSVQIKLGTLYNHFSSQFNKIISKPTPNESVYKLIIKDADRISNLTTISQKVEEKVVISLALRLRCEKYLYKKILRVDNTIINNIHEMQLGELLDQYKIYFPTDIELINFAKKIVIITPYHIHLNSFMFEPLIDVSINNLRDLYKRAIIAFGRF
ncbi:MAG: hypothetical protein RBQ97_06180 [Acholeplasma sp.]|nr:hypothetical protein [Acholeplasma sp.]